METIQIIQLSAEQFTKMLAEAVATGLRQAGYISDPDEQLSIDEAMELTGYTTKIYFKSYCKRNKIQPVATKKRVLFYSKADLVAPTNKKYSR